MAVALLVVYALQARLFSEAISTGFRAQRIVEGKTR